MPNGLRIVLFGSGEVTARSLARLLERGTEVAALVTSPKQNAASEELLTLAEAECIRTLAPKDLCERQFLHVLRNELRPEVILSIAYQHYIPPDVLAVPRWGALNWHPALLPAHRGPDPYFWMLRAGDQETGITVHYMNEEFDCGDIVMQLRTPILAHDTWGTIAKRLDVLALKSLDDTMSLLEHSPAELPRRAQISTSSTFKHRPRPEDFNINWQCDATAIVNLVRACNPNFGARTRFRDNILFIFKATIFPLPPSLTDQTAWDQSVGQSQDCSRAVVGEIVDCDTLGFYVQTGSQLVRVEIVQSNGDYLLSGADFADIERLQVGERLEEIDPVTSIH